MNIEFPDWVTEFPGAVTVCDTEGVIVFMNDKSAKTFEKYGGKGMVGQSLFSCHPEPAATKLRELLDTQGSNAYTIEKGPVKKLIYQSPWFKEGIFRGMVELSLEIPMEMNHFVRQV